MNTLLRLFLEKYMQLGQLTVVSARGEEIRLGDGSGPPVAVRFNTARAERAVASNPALKLGECFMAGEIDMLRGSIYDLMLLGYANAGRALMPAVWMKAFERMRIVVRRLHQINTRVQARGNVQRHYDLSADLYRLFLDPDMQYSCAYYPQPDMSLAQAQLLKKRHIAAKLRLDPEAEVLDIGCGRGGMGLCRRKSRARGVMG